MTAAQQPPALQQAAPWEVVPFTSRASHATIDGSLEIKDAPQTNSTSLVDPRRLRSRKPAGLLPQNANRTFVPCTKPSAWVQERCRVKVEYRENYERLQRDIGDLSLSTLHQTYRREYNSHRGAKERSKVRHVTMDPKLRDFRDWLVHVGQHPDPVRRYSGKEDEMASSGKCPPDPHTWSVDCKDPNSGYIVNNLRWANRETQTRNRKTTRWVKIPGQAPLTIKKFAKFLGRPYQTVYRALNGGKGRRQYSPAELIARSGAGHSLKNWQLPTAEFEEMYKQRTFAYGASKQTRIEWYWQELASEIERLNYGTSKHTMDSKSRVQALKSELARVEEIEERMLIEDLARKELFSNAVRQTVLRAETEAGLLHR